jgi:hypothetical protein
MNTFFPTDPKKLRERIKRYERAFKDRHHDDGAGKRLLLGQLYMLAGDLPGALKSYAWYKKTFPDDTTEPFNHLCWTLALLRSGDEVAAKEKARELVFDNLYIVPIFLGETPANHGFHHFSNWGVAAYILEGPKDELFALWTEDEATWLKTQWQSPELQADIARYIELQLKLDKTSGLEDRRKVMREADRVARGQNHLRIVRTD